MVLLYDNKFIGFMRIYNEYWHWNIRLSSTLSLRIFLYFGFMSYTEYSALKMDVKVIYLKREGKTVCNMHFSMTSACKCSVSNCEKTDIIKYGDKRFF